MTATTTALVPLQPAFSDAERLVLAGFLAGYRGLTREAYALDLRQFTSWCRARSLNVFAVRRADIESFARDLEARGRARATVTRRLCTIAGFYKYAVEEELLEHSPAARVRWPRVDYESHATVLDRNELGALLVAAGLGPPIEHALISLLALNGLRVSEATGADILRAGRLLPHGHSGGVHGFRLYRLPGHGRHLYYHRLPARQRQLRASAWGISVLLRQPRHCPPREDPASDQLRTAAGCGCRPAGHSGRVCQLRPGGVVPLRHTLGVHGLRCHRNNHEARHLRRHRVPGRRRPLRGRPRRTAVLHGPGWPDPRRAEHRQEGLAGDHLRTAAGRNGWPGGPLTASATSGLAVSFRSDTPAVCTVSGATLTPTAVGTCAVTAGQGGSDQYAAARDVEQSIDVASATSLFPGDLTILLAAAVFAAAAGSTLVRRVRRRSRRPRGPQSSVRADPVPGQPALISVKKTGAGMTHTVHIGSSPGASITTIKEGRP